jgi:UDP-N-acetylglucosamine--N-acetylmuramyl-(pentapeptide) pyrophosphoryl-undecaprenol N-acetylglucosamine transferase
MPKKKPLIVWTGGGTAGHVFPALAVYDELKKMGDFRHFWYGSISGMEREILKNYPEITYVGLPSGKLRRYLSLRNFFDLFLIFWALLSAFFSFLLRRPALVFSKGGFVSVPPVMAAGLLGIPVFTHESDFSPGLATRLNIPWCKKIFLAYPEVVDKIPKKAGKRAQVVGNPIRKEIFQGSIEIGRDISGLASDKPVLLVVGGSSGAKQINDLVADSWSSLSEKYHLIHQRGGESPALEADSRHYFSREFFSSELPHLLALSDLVITRGGANFLWELGAVGLPMVIIPLEAGSRGDQVENAEYFSKHFPVRVLKGKEVLPEKLIQALEELESLPKNPAGNSSSLSFTAREKMAEEIHKSLH